MGLGRYLTGDKLAQYASAAALLKPGLRSALKDEPVRFLDIGARGGLSRRYDWLRKRGMIAACIVEPDPEEAARLRAKFDDIQLIEQALGDAEADHTLYITRQPGCSSLLKPLQGDALPPGLRDLYVIEKALPITTTRTASALDAAVFAPEIMKVDVQGFELAILNGMGGYLDTLRCCELEVSFQRCYEAHPLFHEVHEFMLSAGFGMVHMRLFGTRGMRDAVQGDAFYVKLDCDSERHRRVETLFKGASGFDLVP